MTPIARASAHTAADKAPGEIALLAVCGAVVVAVAVVIVRRGRLIRRSAESAPRTLVAGSPIEPLAEAAEPVTDAPAHAHVLHAGDGSGNLPRPAALVSAAVAVVLAVGTVTAVLLVHNHGAATAPSVAAGINQAAGQYPAVGGPAAASPGSGHSASTSPQSRSSAAPSRTSASRGTSAAGAPQATPSPVQPPSGMLTGPVSVRLTPVDAGVTYTASFVVTAENNAVNYTVSEPGSEDADYTVSIGAATGTLQAGGQQTVSVTVTVLDDTEDPYVTLSPGGATVTFTYPPVKITTCPPPPEDCP